VDRFDRDADGLRAACTQKRIRLVEFEFDGHRSDPL
jgi:hypothetical protein